MNWKQKIEAQIAALHKAAEGCDSGEADYYTGAAVDEAADTMSHLLDVAVAVEKQLEDAITYVYNSDTGHYDKPLHDEGLTDSLSDALDKLREVK